MNWRYGLVAAAAVLLTACGSDAPDEAAEADDAIPAQTWRFALEEIEGSVQHVYAERFSELVSDKTDGAVNVRIFPYGQLGGMTDIYDQVQDGAVELAFGSGFLGGTVPESQLFSLNFVLSDDEWRNTQALNSDSFRKSDEFLEAFRDRELHPLAVVPEGWQVWTANKPIHTPDDFSGVAIRTMDNRLLRETYRAYGADPTTMEYGEIYSGLQLGQIDANIQPVFAHQEMDFYQVQDYMIFANQAQFIATFMANRDWYDGLSDELKDIVEETVLEMVEYIHDAQVTLNNERLETITSESDIELIRLSQDERETFRELSLPVRELFVERVGERGEQLLELLLAAVEREAERDDDEERERFMADEQHDEDTAEDENGDDEENAEE